MRPEPVLNRATIAGAVAAVFYVLARVLDLKLGSGAVEAAADAVAGLIVAGAPVVAALRARKHVTPVRDPMDVTGERFVRTARKAT